MYSRAGRSSRTQVASNAETQFVFNILVWGGLGWIRMVQLESGLRTVIALVYIAGLAYYFIGYNLMYVVGS